MTITAAPYSGVTWATDLRLKMQTHDHCSNEARMLDQIEAGMKVISVIDYGGWADHASTSKILSLQFDTGTKTITTAHATQAVIDAATAAGAAWYPCIEQTGDVDVGDNHHWTSPFCEAYVEWVAAEPGDNEYTDQADGLQHCLDHGGFPCLAHPVDNPDWISLYHAVEIWNGSMYGKDAADSGSRMTLMRQYVESQLIKDPTIYIVCVDDHRGSFAWRDSYAAGVLDGGHIDLLVPDASYNTATKYAACKLAYENGYFLGIVDFGPMTGSEPGVKGDYPTVTSITTSGDTITIVVDGTVSWKSEGAETVGSSKSIDTSKLYGHSFVRAEITDSNGSIIYTQLWVLDVPMIGSVNQ